MDEFNPLAPVKTKEDIIISINNNISQKNMMYKSQAKKVQEELYRNKNLGSLKKEIEINKEYIRNTKDNLPEISKYNKQKELKEIFNLTDLKEVKEKYDRVSDDNDEISYILSDEEMKNNPGFTNLKDFDSKSPTPKRFKRIESNKPIFFKKKKNNLLNANSVFASFRSEILKSKEKVNTEIENFKQLRKTINKLKKKCYLICHSRNEPNQPISSLKLPQNLNTENLVNKLPQILTTETNEILATNATTQSEIMTTDNNLDNPPLILKGIANTIETDKPLKPINNNVKKNSRKSKIILTENTSMLQNTQDQGYSRKKTFKVKYLANWYEKTGYAPYKMTEETCNNIEFQSNIVSDEMKILLENIQYYKMMFLNGNEIIGLFQSLNINKQQKYNIVLEETCALLMEISNSILLDFYNYLEKFVSIQAPNSEKFRDVLVKNETNAFILNCKLLAEVSIFLKGCFEVYTILIKQVDDLVIPLQIFVKVLQYLSRARNNTSNLIFLTKNYQKNYQSDLKLVNKYGINNVNENKRKEYLLERKKGESHLKYYINYNNNKQEIEDTYAEKIRNELMFKKNEENERKRRLNNVLNKKYTDFDESFEEKKNEVSKKLKKNTGLNSKVVSKLLKYCNKETKNKIISQRIIERYKEQAHDSGDG